ncbi:MAG: archease [Thermoplasmata archaeon]|nr:archease [Thermoplasmata archaeon]MCI4337690.1 archease [Thermoplasmata archaeon]MCI4340836.1 archease [Thermoplasmata archaeon]
MHRRATARTGPRRRWGSFPTTADVGIWGRAGTPEGVFESLGVALSSLSVDLRGVRPLEERRVQAHGFDPTSLLVDYLGRLLLLEQQEGFLLRSVAVHLEGRPPTALEGRVRGERYDPARHRRKKEVKAITLHDLQLDLSSGRGRVIVDI